ncbi:hypothetical protein IM40_06630 [Candidatus Paracaedimonas acanthamoebae]|nr:hypothetical protein IM40_06630 [Candidatus Paracaedimonas acanthamoebae]
MVNSLQEENAFNVVGLLSLSLLFINIFKGFALDPKGDVIGEEKSWLAIKYSQGLTRNLLLLRP